MYQTIQLIRKSIGTLLLIPVVIACFGFLPSAQAVNPPPDGAYAGFNTAEGQNALFSLTTGVWNTADGGYTLFFNNTGQGNTAVGLNALRFNTNGSSNTAVGVNALVHNGAGAIQNTAVGQGALANNTDNQSTAVGYQALGHNTSGFANTAVGAFALLNNTVSGNSSNAFGFQALLNQTDGLFNNGFGWNALFSNVHGGSNTAIGDGAGFSVTGSGNVCIGAGISGIAGANNTTQIRNVYASVASTRIVYVNSNNKIGTLASSRRYKNEIKPMDKVSEALLALKPVTFRYKHEFDPDQTPMFGLIAEEVEKVNPDLVLRNEKGEVDTVRYDAINAMMLNEFIKEHRKVQDLERTVAQQQKGMEVLAASLKEQASQIQKVSARLEARRPAPKVVANE